MSNLATEKQLGFIASLLRDREVPSELREAASKVQTKEEARVIDALLKFPKKTRKPASTQTPEEGFYFVDRFYVKIQRNLDGNRVYGKVWSEEDERWNYAPSALRTVRPEHKLTEEQAKRFGDLYGRCVCCGRRLTDEESISRGIGPICAGKYL